VILKNRNKLSCDCFEDVFTGVPCRHLMALIAKGEEKLSPYLPFNKRWEINYYQDTQEENLHQVLSFFKDEEKEENNQVKL